MNSFELNKILGAVLGTCLVLLSLNITAGALVLPRRMSKSRALRLRSKEAPAGGGQQQPQARAAGRDAAGVSLV